jgi:hypothetical protein
MDPKTESDARYLEGGGLVLLSLILMFVAKWAFQKAALFDDGETVFPQTIPPTLGSLASHRLYPLAVPGSFFPQGKRVLQTR